MNKKLKQAGILLGILILPSLFYVVLSTGEHQIGRAPFFGPKEIHPTKKIKRDIPDTIFYSVPDYGFTDLQGNKRSLGDLSGQIVVVNFFCLDCYDENFRVLEQMGKLHARFKDKPEVTLLSVLIDSANKGSLPNAMDEYPMGTSGWEIWEPVGDWQVFAKESLLLGTEFSDFALNPGTLVLLDGDRHIRGYYDGKQYVETNALMDAMKALRFKYFRPSKDKDNEQ